MTPPDLDARVRALEEQADDREALRRRLESALQRAEAAERELSTLRAQSAGVVGPARELMVSSETDRACRGQKETTT